MDTKNYPWYLVNRKEGKEYVVENIKWDLKNEQLHYNPETLICINPSEYARLYQLFLIMITLVRAMQDQCWNQNKLGLLRLITKSNG